MSTVAFSKAYTDHNIRQRRLDVATNAAWKSGALLFVNASDQWEECGADPAVIGGISLDEVGDGTGALVPIGRRENPPYTCGGLLVTAEELFSGPYVGTPAIGTYGVVKGADGIWRVDFAETVNTRVRVVDIKSTVEPAPVYPYGAASPFRLNGAEISAPVPNGAVLFVILAANAQQA